ncbi:response regulator [Halovenus sp. WSH3]|uniref:Response regulator n=1 Tax=Halovenus carboxidivorans TaxID=2692199 RepID=A0A6B0SYR6_9EURY|nr:response regulator [Halovenus carboxidivorans]MXR50928.1 response regulator [Halovenus carboxidivorans]
MSERPLVLAVDDEERVVQAFDIWLGDEFEVLTATGGAEALEQISDEVDVVLLDRHMPEMSGDEVLERIRAEGYDCRVAMVTAVAPEFEIVEMPFDHYISKPVDESELREVVGRLAEMGAYDQRLNELYRVTQKIATLEAEMTDSRLEHHEEYSSLVERRDRLRAETHDLVGEMERSELDDVFEMIGSEQ